MRNLAALVLLFSVGVMAQEGSLKTEVTPQFQSNQFHEAWTASLNGQYRLFASSTNREYDSAIPWGVTVMRNWQRLAVGVEFATLISNSPPRSFFKIESQRYEFIGWLQLAAYMDSVFRVGFQLGLGTSFTNVDTFIGAQKESSWGKPSSFGASSLDVLIQLSDALFAGVSGRLYYDPNFQAYAFGSFGLSLGYYL